MYATRLTKHELEDFGFKAAIFNKEKNDWLMLREAKGKGRDKQIYIKEVRPYLNINKHKYTADTGYYCISFWGGSRAYTIPLSKFLYAWFYGEVPEGYVVDHINNDHYDNRIENLQILTIGDNIRKKYTDDPNA